MEWSFQKPDFVSYLLPLPLGLISLWSNKTFYKNSYGLPPPPTHFLPDLSPRTFLLASLALVDTFPYCPWTFQRRLALSPWRYPHGLCSKAIFSWRSTLIILFKNPTLEFLLWCSRIRSISETLGCRFNSRCCPSCPSQEHCFFPSPR